MALNCSKELKGSRHEKAPLQSQFRQSDQGQEATIPEDGYNLIGFALLAALGVWLIFSLIRKLFGLALLIAVAIGVWLIWNQPEIFGGWAEAAMRLLTP